MVIATATINNAWDEALRFEVLTEPTIGTGMTIKTVYGVVDAPTVYGSKCGNRAERRRAGRAPRR